MVKKKKATKASKKKEKENKLADPVQPPQPTVPAEPEKPEKKKEDGSMTCKRCGHKYVKSEIVIIEQQKCCPECYSPISWES